MLLSQIDQDVYRVYKVSVVKYSYYDVFIWERVVMLDCELEF